MGHIKDIVLKWNYKFPVDRWWREKHKIAFNSPEHRNSNFWDQLFEFEEDKLYAKLQAKKEDYQPNEKDWLDIMEAEYTSLEDKISNAMDELNAFKSTLNE